MREIHADRPRDSPMDSQDNYSDPPRILVSLRLKGKLLKRVGLPGRRFAALLTLSFDGPPSFYMRHDESLGV